MSDLVQTDVPELKYKDALGGGRFLRRTDAKRYQQKATTTTTSRRRTRRQRRRNERKKEMQRGRKKTKFNVGDVVIKVYVKRGHVPDLQKQEKEGARYR